MSVCAWKLLFNSSKQNIDKFISGSL